MGRMMGMGTEAPGPRIKPTDSEDTSSARALGNTPFAAFFRLNPPSNLPKGSAILDCRGSLQ